MSFVQVDDTDPLFTYKDNAWTTGGESGEYESTSHSSSTAGAVVEFGPFKGTSIAVFSTVGTRQTKMHFQVDGGEQSVNLVAETNPSVQFQQEVYSATNLDPTAQHTLNINLLDAGPFTLDYVVIGGQSNTVLQQPTSVPSSSSAAPSQITSTGTSSVIDSPPTSTNTRGVGPVITSASISDITASLTPSASVDPSQKASFSSTTSSSFISSDAGPTPSGPNSAQPTASVGPTTSTPSASSATSMGAASSSGPDAIVIGSVTGSIVFFAIVVVFVVLCLRRRRRLGFRRRSVPNAAPFTGPDSRPKQRPALHLSIPSSLSLPRSLLRPSLLPTHSNKSLPSLTKHSTPFGTSHAAPSFLAEDPNDSPVFDIKQRPVSGATMTTRVTVGTTIDQRISVPDSVYRYQYLESPAPVPEPVPPMPALPTKSSNPSPTETGTSSATGSPSRFGFGLLGTNQGGTLDTAVFSGYSENGTGASGSVPSASRPLPHIPADGKRGHTLPNSGPEQNPSQMQDYRNTHRFFPTTPSEVETVFHQDGGVRLDSNLQIRPRRELPPPYQDYGV